MCESQLPINRQIFPDTFLLPSPTFQTCSEDPTSAYLSRRQEAHAPYQLSYTHTHSVLLTPLTTKQDGVERRYDRL